MNPSDIKARLKAAKRCASSDAKQDHIMDRLLRILSQYDPVDQLIVMAAIHASLVLEIAGGERKDTTAVWQASMAQSAALLQEFERLSTPADAESLS